MQKIIAIKIHKILVKILCKIIVKYIMFFQMYVKIIMNILYGLETNMNHTYKIAICDDEPKILDDLVQRIKDAFIQLKLEAEYCCTTDSAQMMEHLQTNAVDVIFLDIDMPVFSGMDIAGFLNEKYPQAILVFVTSHDALVYQSFAYRPFGFIRKTHLDEELQDVMGRIGKELQNRKRDIVITKGQELVRILLQDILYLESEGNYLNVYTRNEVLRVRETMTNMEKELLEKDFLRCHKGYLINAEYIEKFKTTEIDLRMGNVFQTVPVGRSYEKEVRSRIMELLR